VETTSLQEKSIKFTALDNPKDKMPKIKFKKTISFMTENFINGDLKTGNCSEMKMASWWCGSMYH
jgi:hypothetical protein